VPSRSYGLIVEGPYDIDFFRVIVARVAANNPTIELLEGGGNALLRRFPTLLRRFEHIIAGEPVGKALVIKDADGHPVDEVEGIMANRLGNQTYIFPEGVELCGVQQEMETWLLADVQAINQVSTDRGKRDGVPIIHGTLEEMFQAKERLRSALSRAGLDYTPPICAEIAAKADLERLRQRCPSFRRFEEKILA